MTTTEGMESRRPRGRGRPRTIDREAALDRAVETFWALGYDGASLDDLTSAMGLSRPSLYTAFGDKHALFLAALDRYASGIGAEPMAAFEAETDVTAAVRAFLETSLVNNTRPGGAPGCLLACCAATSVGAVPGVDERLAGAFADTARRLGVRFAHERDAGSLAASPSPAARAALTVDLMNGQAVRARAGASRRTLRTGLAERVRAVVGVSP